MRKYMDVDIVAALGTVLEINTELYKSDFKYDIAMFKDASADPDAEKYFVWLSRQNGTECFRERDVYLRDTSAYNSWIYYADSKSPIRAYAVEVTGSNNGRVMGNLYELDHPTHVKQLGQDALPVQKAEARFEDGSMLTLPYEQYKRDFMALQNQYGRIQEAIYHPESEAELQRRMQKARDERQGHTPAVFKARISKRPSIHDQLRAAREIADKQQSGKRPEHGRLGRTQGPER